jgi:hypothetical protein
VPKIKEIGRFKIDANVSVFITCFFVSFLFWIMIVLSKEYTAYIFVKTNYTNLPEDKILTYKLPSELRLEVNATGFVLVSKTLTNSLQTINIDATPPKKNGRYNVGDEFVLQLQSQTSQITEQLDNSYKIKSVFPDNISFYLASKSQKVVPVKYHINYNFLSQFSYTDSIHISPKKILLKGPKQILDKINFVDTDSITIDSIKENVTKTVNFILTDELKQVKTRTTKGVIYIPVDKFTETEIELPITINTSSVPYNIKTFPVKTKVKFLVTLSKFKSIKPILFSVSANIKNIDLLKANKLNLTLDKYPSYVKNPILSPSEVEFILNQKQ